MKRECLKQTSGKGALSGLNTFQPLCVPSETNSSTISRITYCCIRGSAMVWLYGACPVPTRGINTENHIQNISNNRCAMGKKPFNCTTLTQREKERADERVREWERKRKAERERDWEKAKKKKWPEESIWDIRGPGYFIKFTVIRIILTLLCETHWYVYTIKS